MSGTAALDGRGARGDHAPLLHIRNLEVAYDRTVVARVPALSLHAGGCTAIVGGSGSGKTTTLRAVLGLAAEAGAEVSGSIEVAGIEVVGADDATLRSLRGGQVGYVTQSPRSALTPTLRLRRYARIVLARHGVGRREADARIARAAEEVHLDADVLTRYPHEISGGQAQRFALALALALGAGLLLADEPTSALDVTVQAEVLRVIDELRRSRGLGVLLVTHDLALVAELADDVLVMVDGEVVESGPVAQVLVTPTHPATRELVASVPEIGGHP